MSWLPCTTSTSGKGPSPRGYHTRALRGISLGVNPQYSLRSFADRPRSTSLEPSTDSVVSVTESR